MLYEVRVYAVAPGRGADIEARMLEAVPRLFRAHGMRAVAHWTAVAGIGLPAFIYVLEWSDMATREAGWARFYADERWWRIRADSNGGSEMVEHYGLWLMRPNGAWLPPMEPFGAAHELHDLVVHRVEIGQATKISALLAEAVFPAVAQAGGRVVAALDMIAGPRVPATVLIFAWPDFAARTAGWSALEALCAADAHILGRRDVYLLRPHAERAGSQFEEQS
jgi:hypothetical protein